MSLKFTDAPDLDDLDDLDDDYDYDAPASFGPLPESCCLPPPGDHVSFNISGPRHLVEKTWEAIRGSGGGYSIDPMMLGSIAALTAGSFGSTPIPKAVKADGGSGHLEISWGDSIRATLETYDKDGEPLIEASVTVNKPPTENVKPEPEIDAELEDS